MGGCFALVFKGSEVGGVAPMGGMAPPMGGGSAPMDWKVGGCPHEGLLLWVGGDAPI